MSVFVRLFSNPYFGRTTGVVKNCTSFFYLIKLSYNVVRLFYRFYFDRTSRGSPDVSGLPPLFTYTPPRAVFLAVTAAM